MKPTARTEQRTQGQLVDLKDCQHTLRKRASLDGACFALRHVEL